MHPRKTDLILRTVKFAFFCVCLLVISLVIYSMYLGMPEGHETFVTMWLIFLIVAWFTFALNISIEIIASIRWAWEKISVFMPERDVPDDLFDYKRPKKRRRRREIETTPDYMEDRPETTGDILKGLGIERGKPKREKITPVKRFGLNFPVIRGRKVSKDDLIRRKWKPIIDYLESGKSLKVSKNDHYGRLRGMNIVLAAKSDLKRLGYTCKIKKKGKDGWLWFEKQKKSAENGS